MSSLQRRDHLDGLAAQQHRIPPRATSSMVCETTYFVVEFMCVLNGFPSLTWPHILAKSCQVGKPSRMLPGLLLSAPISRIATSSL
jgi:hypothetical protein